MHRPLRGTASNWPNTVWTTSWPPSTSLVAISKEAAQGKALVAGDMTMTGQQLYPMGDLTFEELVDVYRQQAKVLYDAGVDLFIVEP